MKINLAAVALFACVAMICSESNGQLLDRMLGRGGCGGQATSSCCDTPAPSCGGASLCSGIGQSGRLFGGGCLSNKLSGIRGMFASSGSCGPTCGGDVVASPCDGGCGGGMITSDCGCGGGGGGFLSGGSPILSGGGLLSGDCGCGGGGGILSGAGGGCGCGAGGGLLSGGGGILSGIRGIFNRGGGGGCGCDAAPMASPCGCSAPAPAPIAAPCGCDGGGLNIGGGGGLLSRLRGGIGGGIGGGGCGCDAAPMAAPCGCSAPAPVAAPCGCSAPAPSMGSGIVGGGLLSRVGNMGCGSCGSTSPCGCGSAPAPAMIDSGCGCSAPAGEACGCGGGGLDVRGKVSGIFSRVRPSGGCGGCGAPSMDTCGCGGGGLDLGGRVSGVVSRIRPSGGCGGCGAPSMDTCGCGGGGLNIGGGGGLGLRGKVKGLFSRVKGGCSSCGAPADTCGCGGSGSALSLRDRLQGNRISRDGLAVNNGCNPPCPNSGCSSCDSGCSSCGTAVAAPAAGCSSCGTAPMTYDGATYDSNMSYDSMPAQNGVIYSQPMAVPSTQPMAVPAAQPAASPVINDPSPSLSIPAATEGSVVVPGVEGASNTRSPLVDPSAFVIKRN